MKFKLPVLAMLCVFTLYGNAQSNTSSPKQDEEIFNNYTIHVYNNPNGGYGYDIFYQQALVAHQPQNPFNDNQRGLKNKSDAFKISKWQISQLLLTRQQVKPVAKKIPIEVARQLSIDTN